MMPHLKLQTKQKEKSIEKLKKNAINVIFTNIIFDIVCKQKKILKKRERNQNQINRSES